MRHNEVMRRIQQRVSGVGSQLSGGGDVVVCDGIRGTTPILPLRTNLEPNLHYDDTDKEDRHEGFNQFRVHAV